ncbi:hypothetical protein RSJ42_04690 [Methanosarcina hadiensis]
MEEEKDGKGRKEEEKEEEKIKGKQTGGKKERRTQVTFSECL